jgi:signal transduction histidine kinase
VDVTGYQAGSGALRLVVRDHGRGMSPRVLGHAFDEFYRGDESGGLGLGLPAMKYVMEAHAGRAWLESRPRRGTKVVLEIPRERVAGG